MPTTAVTPTSDITTTDWGLNGGSTFFGTLAANGSNSVQMTGGTSANALVMGTGFSIAGMSAITAVTFTVNWKDSTKSGNGNFEITLVESGTNTQLATMTAVATSSTSEITSGPTSMTLQAAASTLANWANFDIQLATQISGDFGGVFYGLSLTLTYTTSSVPGAPTISLANDATNPTTAIDVTVTGTTGSPTGFTIQRATTKGGTFTTIATNVSSPYTDSQLTPGSEYAYQAAGVNGSGTGSYCSPDATATEPAAPTSLSATATATSITVSFTAPTVGSNIATSSWAARIETPVGSGSWTSLGTVSNPFTAFGLSPLTQYGIEVDASIQSTNGDFSGSIVGPWSSELTVVSADDGRHQNFETGDSSSMLGSVLHHGAQHVAY